MLQDIQSDLPRPYATHKFKEDTKEPYMPIENLLNHKVAIVTGAGRGIGKAVAKRLAKAGASVVLAARTEAEIQAVAEEIKAA